MEIVYSTTTSSNAAFYWHSYAVRDTSANVASPTIPGDTANGTITIDSDPGNDVNWTNFGNFSTSYKNSSVGWGLQTQGTAITIVFHSITLRP